MKQIKTIMAKVKKAEEFDREVNEALERGWCLRDRKLLDPHHLYAELERDDHVPKGAHCSNCREFDRRDSIHALCHKCRHLDQWRP